MSLKNKIALITGGAKGIGRAIAFRLGGEGAALVLGDIDRKALSKTQSDLGSIGVKVISSKCDVAVEKDVQDLVSVATGEHGRIDILVNNAGGTGTTPTRLEDITESDWNFVSGLNLDSVFLTIRSVVPIMVKQGGGAIVNIASIAGRRGGNLSGVAYASAKGGGNISQ